MRRSPKYSEAIFLVIVVLASASFVLAQRELTIAQVQGAKNLSAFDGQSVRVTGTVTARTRTGFFLQTPDDKVDADANTSEGIFVFTGTRAEPPIDVVVGNLVSVSGKVEEFKRETDTLALTITEISHRAGSDQLSVVSKSNPLPKQIALSESDFKTNRVDQLERYEGMRITVASLVTVSPTSGRENEKTGQWESDGTFSAVLKGIPRPFREAGLDIREFLTSPDQEKLKKEFPKLPLFDTNPEIIRIDTNEQIGGTATVLNVTSQMEITNLTGVLHYSFGRPTILSDVNARPNVTGGIKANPLTAPTDRQFSVVGMNIENFFDDEDDAGIREPVAPAEAWDRRLKKISMAVREAMQAPDVIGVVEAENIKALKKLADRINADSVAAGKPDPKYQAYLTEGNDGRGIDNGFLVKTSRVNVVEVKQIGKDDKYQNPVTKEDVLLNDRTPLMLRASIADAQTGKPFEFTIVVNHLKSYSGFNDPRQMANVRLKKKLQSEFLARWLDARQKANPQERIMLIGDLNSYQFSDGVLDMIGTIKGTPAAKDAVMMPSDDIVTRDMIDLVDVIAAPQRYSYIFDGNAQVLDHIIISETLKNHIKGFGYVRVNADFPESMRNDATRPERFSDHDPAIAYFSLDSIAGARP